MDGVGKVWSDPNRIMRAYAGLLVCWFSLFCSQYRAAADSSISNTVSLVALPLYNATQASTNGYWQHSIPWLIEGQLGELIPLQTIPRESVRFAYQTAHLTVGQKLTPTQAQDIGSIVQADWVLWGAYQSVSGKTEMLLQLTTSNGKIYKTYSCHNLRWKELLSAIAQDIATNTATSSLWSSAGLPHDVTDSSQALEFICRAYAQAAGGGALLVAERDAHQAVDLDPSFAEAHQLLARIQLATGKLNEAALSAKKALSLKPRYARARHVLGLLALLEGDKDSAQIELQTAQKLDPWDPENYERLGECYGIDERWNKAVDAFKRAASLSPYNGDVHAQLARAYIHLDKHEEALAELQRATQCSQFSQSSADVHQLLAEAYESLNEIPEAAAHLEAFISAAKEEGLQSPAVGDAEKHITELQSRLSAHYVEVTNTTAFAPIDTNAELRKLLSQEECSSIPNPLAATPKMRTWALQLLGKPDDSNDLEKARRLFSGIISRSTRRFDEEGRRTAQQAFEVWSNSDVSLTCQEYALLYVVLARAVGLKACIASVEKDYRGRLVPHACAAVLLNQKALLVDPALVWFGVPHQEFTFQDDLHVVGIYLSQLRNPETCQIAVKLVPDLPMTHFNLAIALVQQNRPEAAWETLKKGLALAPNTWQACFAEGFLESHEANWKAAVSHFRSCLSSNVDFPKARFFLAKALFCQGALKASREQFLLYLQGDTEPALADEARQAIDYIERH